MSGLTGFTVAFCSVCVLIGGLYLLCPPGKMEKPLRYIFGLIFVCCLVTSALGFKKVDFSLPSYAQTTKQNDNMSIAAAEYAFRIALTNAKINFKKITVCTDKTEDGSIIITKVIIYSPDSAEKIRQTLGGDAASYEVEVVYE